MNENQNNNDPKIAPSLKEQLPTSGLEEILLPPIKEKSQQNYELNNKLIDKHYNTQQLGQLFGFLSISFVIIGGVLVSIFGHPISGGTLSLSGLAALGGAFIVNYKFRKKKKEKKK